MRASVVTNFPLVLAAEHQRHDTRANQKQAGGLGNRIGPGAEEGRNVVNVGEASL